MRLSFLSLAWKWSVIFLLASTFLACTKSGDDGDSGGDLTTNACGVLGLPIKSGRSAKIINGTACGGLAQSPVVRVVSLDNSGTQLGGICTGTVIDPNFVLTAAHCFLPGFNRVVVVTGAAGSYETWIVREVNIHPNYGQVGAALANDIAVLELSKPISVAPVSLLPASVHIPQDGDVVQVFGYGQDENNNSFEDLRSGEMEISDVIPSHIQSDYRGDGSNVCFGDSGGPMIYVADGLPYQIGVVSTGNGTSDCGKGDSTLFINLQSAEVLSFIDGVVG